MARPLRIEYAGAAYHVMARCNQGSSVFRADADRKRFVATLDESCEKTGWRIHSYMLVSNHYHLLVETPEGNLVAGMKWLQGTYTRVTKAVSRMKRKAASKLRLMRETLRALEPREPAVQ